jgi:putative ABC transport system permease protein
MIAICAVLCLALGLGATTAIASAIDRALVRSLPFRDASRLVTVYRVSPQANDWPFSVPKYLDLKRGVKQISSLGALAWSSRLLAMPDGGVQMRTIRVTGNLFPLLGVRALRGRLIDTTDDSPGQNPVVVMTDEAWRAQFNSDPGIVGRTVRLDGVPTTVVGILPPGFHVPHGMVEMHGDLWIPFIFTKDELAKRGHNFVNLVGRLAPGATVASAGLELKRLVDIMVQQYPMLRGESARAAPMQADSVNLIRTPLLLVFAAVCVVLLIAAANVGSLLLARGVHRQREMAVRTALGASRWAVMRPALAEGLLLAFVGGLVGLGLAWVAVRTIGSLASDQLPQLTGLSIEIRIVVFAVALSTIVALLCSALPAWYSATVDPQDALRGERSGGGGVQKRALGALVAFEVALSLVLLIGASLVLRGFEALTHRDPGFDPRNLLTVTATISPERYADSTTVSRFLVPAIQAIEQIPGVRSAGAISDLPYREWGDNSNIRYEGQPGDDMEHLPLADDRQATPDFFKATGQRLVGGRLSRYDDDLRPGQSVTVVVNEALQRRDFPHGTAVGKRFYISDSTFATIVGVVSDIANAGPFDLPVPEVYWSYNMDFGGDAETLFPLVVRVSGDPTKYENAVRAAIHSVDPVAAVSEVGPMTDVIAKSVGAPRFYLVLLSGFALVALILAVAGLYGVMSYSVAQRTRELGIRTALGSSAVSIVGMVTSEGMKLVGVGVVAGIIGGALATRVLQSLLYGVSPANIATWAMATGALVAAGLLAAFVPAFRATLVDPVVAIKVE